MAGSRRNARGVSVTQDGRIFDSKSGMELSPVPRLEDGTTYFWCVEVDEYVHRLVAEAWIPRPAGTAEVFHRDGNGSNNRTTNLVWLSMDDYRNALGRRLFDSDLDKAEKAFLAEKDLDRRDKKRRRSPLMPRNMKVTPTQVRNIRRASRAGASHRALAKKYGISPLAVFNIVHLRSWKWIPDDDISEADPDLEEDENVIAPF